MPWGGVATDFQPSYALEAPGVTRDELVVRFDPRSPTAPSAARAAAEPCPRFASRGKSGCRRRHWLERGHSLHGRPTSQKPPYDLAFRFPGSRVTTSAGPARRTARIRLRTSPSGIAPRGRSRPRGAIQPRREPRRAPRTTATAARSRRAAPAARGRAGCGIRGTARGPTQSVSARQGAPRCDSWHQRPPVPQRECRDEQPTKRNEPVRQRHRIAQGRCERQAQYQWDADVDWRPKPIAGSIAHRASLHPPQ
jgi:hypothetical protein